MPNLMLIAIIAGAVYALRLAGMYTAQLAIPPLLERALGFAPLAIIAALVTSSLSGQGTDDPLRYLAAAGAALIAWATRRLWACILGGFALYWLMTLVWATIR
jgi:branched-subunit amino acid transport protein